MERKSKAQPGAIIVLCVLAITFTFCTAILGSKLPSNIQGLKEAKQTLQQGRIEYAELESSIDTYTDEIEELQELIKKRQQELEEVEDQEPIINETGEEDKFAYLTFDDGPSENTDKILDFLKANNIKATFFVLGKEEDDAAYKRIVEEGHTLALHSNTHQYSAIYASAHAFMADINTLSDRLERITGERPTILRFPGGSNNTISQRYGGKDIMDRVIKMVNEAGITYYDWNVDSSDATANKQDKDVIVSSVLNGARGKKKAIILMHDAAPKTTTVEALPEIVEGLRAQGFVFRPITEDVEPITFKQILK